MIRVTMFFEADKYGWSETLYSSQASSSDALDAGKALIPRRVGCLGEGAALIGLRASDDDSRQDSLFHSVNANDGKPTANTSSDIPHTCLDCRMEASSLHRRAYQLRGIPDDIVRTNGGLLIDGIYQGKLDRYRTVLLAGGWGMKVRNTPVGAHPILSITNDPSGYTVTVVTTEAHGLQLNDLAYISGRSNVKGFNGIWRVSATTPTEFQILTSKRATPPFFGLYVRKLTYSFAAFSNMIFERASHRITGRPFGAPLGKRKGRSRI